MLIIVSGQFSTSALRDCSKPKEYAYEVQFFCCFFKILFSGFESWPYGNCKDMSVIIHYQNLKQNDC